MIPLFNDDLTLAPEENFQFRPLYRARDQEVSDEEFLTYLQEFNKVYFLLILILCKLIYLINNI